jgi:probable rRNA maturation factor
MPLAFQLVYELDPEIAAALEEAARRMVVAAGMGDGLDGEPEVTLRLVGDEEMRALNRDYRSIDRPTDVLAFAMREAPGGEAAPELLGDVVVSVETADRQRRGALGDELRFLFAHGLCHLLGYDHQSDVEEAEMNARIKSLLAESERDGRVRAA